MGNSELTQLPPREAPKQKEKKDENTYLKQISQTIGKIKNIANNLLLDLSQVQSTIQSTPPVQIVNLPLLLSFKKRSFSSDENKEIIEFVDSNGGLYTLEVFPEKSLSAPEQNDWTTQGILPNKYLAKITVLDKFIEIFVEKDANGNIRVINRTNSDLELLRLALNILDSAEALFTKAISKMRLTDESPPPVADSLELLKSGKISHRDADFEWEVNDAEKTLNTRASSNVGQFKVFTNYPLEFEKGVGTLFIYFQGTHVKFGHDDTIENSPLSWMDVNLLPRTNKELLTIEHPAKKSGFMHFISFVFPHVLDQEGIKISTEQLLKFLDGKNFETAVLAHSLGATLFSEWLTNMINEQNENQIESMLKNIKVVLCGGGPCDSVDIEPKALMLAKVVIGNARKAIAPTLFWHSYFRNAGGVSDIMGRYEYLTKLNNVERCKSIQAEKWQKASEIFAKFPDFKMIFLSDNGQRAVLSSGPIKWFQIFNKTISGHISGYIAKDIASTDWVKIPSASHGEIKNLWSLISLLGLSPPMRKNLKFTPLALEIANEWPKRRLEKIEGLPTLI